MKKNYDEIIAMIEAMKMTSAPVTAESHLYSDLGLDSLMFVDLLIRIEEVYAITFDLFEMESCLRVDGLFALLDDKCAAKQSCP